MRKILLGTTAVVGAALLAPSVASAQEAPTVRIGGYFQAYFGNTIQTGSAATNVSMNTIGGGEAGQSSPFQGNVGGNTGAVAPTGTTTGLPAGSIGVANTSQNQQGSARLGHNDFSSDAEIHVFVNGKTANGLSYGAVLEMAFNQQEGSVRNSGRRAVNDKTTAFMDEYYAFISSPTLGQIRFGDEDGPMGGLMNAGFITNFGSGGVYGYWENFVHRPNRTTTSPGGLGDNTKLIYLSPQVFGFDVGVSWAFNEGSGEDVGCLNSFASINCDRVYAVTGPGNNSRSHALPGRTNELQAMLRWRGNIAGVGIAASAGMMSSQVIRNIDLTGAITKTLQSPQVYQVGLQATWQGLTVGANYMWGNTSFFYIPVSRGVKPMEQWFLGASYTFGPFTIGANGFWGSYGQLPGAAGANGAATFTGVGAPMQKRYAFSVGANYRLAPGMDIVVEWTQHTTTIAGTTPAAPLGFSQQGLGACSATQVNNCSNKATAQVFMIGTRLAF
ncbi:MAG: porin [Acetobacteraceae bacterium]|nr:porin [Acetobacteraceae bacterium]